MWANIKAAILVLIIAAMSPQYIKQGFAIMVSIPWIILLSVFSVALFNIVIHALLSKGKDTKVDHTSLSWVIAHNSLYKYSVIFILLTFQLSLFAFFFKGSGSDFLTMFSILIASLYLNGLLILGKRK